MYICKTNNKLNYRIMNINKFKIELKQVLKANPQKINLSITGLNGYEIYSNKRDFCLRILEVFENESFSEIILTSAKEKNCFAISTSSFSWVLKNISSNLESLEFHINTIEQELAYNEQKKNMTLEQKSVIGYGSNN